MSLTDKQWEILRGKLSKYFSEDIAQEALLRLSQQPVPPTYVIAWTGTVARHLWVSWNGKWKRQEAIKKELSFAITNKVVQYPEQLDRLIALEVLEDVHNQWPDLFKTEGIPKHQRKRQRDRAKKRYAID